MLFKIERQNDMAWAGHKLQCIRNKSEFILCIKLRKCTYLHYVELEEIRGVIKARVFPLINRLALDTSIVVIVENFPGGDLS